MNLFFTLFSKNESAALKVETLVLMEKALLLGFVCFFLKYAVPSKLRF